MTSAAFTDILCARSATVIVSGTTISRTIGLGLLRPRDRPPSSSWRWRPPFGLLQPAVAAPPVTSPRSLSARRRAASSWNAWPGGLLRGLVLLLARLGGGLDAACRRSSRRPAGRRPCAAASLRRPLPRRLRRRPVLRRRPWLRLLPAPASWSCAWFPAPASCCRSSCWRAISSRALRSSASRAACSSALTTGCGCGASLGASSTGAGAASDSSRRTKTRFLRTSTWIVRALPLDRKP